MKYLIYKNRGTEYPLIFSDDITHSTMASRMGCREIAAAGFIDYHPVEGIRCFGKSVSLHKQSRKTDTAFVTAALRSQRD